MSHIKYVPGMPWKLVDGVRVPDLDAIRACPFPTPYTASQFGARPVLACDPDEGYTSQEFKGECDINTIMRRFVKTGALPNRTDAASYGDFSNITDYLDAFNQVQFAQTQFESLPSQLRERFQHPGELLAFLADETNRDEAYKLGIISPPPKQAASAESTPPKTNDPTNKPAG